MRGRLRAYVCGRACVHWTPDEGFSTLDAIMAGRPENCRYAVVEPGIGAGTTVAVVDLYNMLVRMQYTYVTDGAPSWSAPDDAVRYFPNLDAAVMAACLTYEE